LGTARRNHVAGIEPSAFDTEVNDRGKSLFVGSSDEELSFASESVWAALV